MDISPIINQMFHVFWYLIPLIVIGGIIKSPWFKGMIGEFMINLSAKFLLDKNKYHLIKNVLLPTEDGTTQIDHIIVSVYGVFVVETKNMKGWIFGNPNQPYWTQKIYKNTTKFQNLSNVNYFVRFASIILSGFLLSMAKINDPVAANKIDPLIAKKYQELSVFLTSGS